MQVHHPYQAADLLFWSSMRQAVSIQLLAQFTVLVQCLQVLEDHSRPVLSLAIAGDKLFSGSYDYTIKVWSLDTLQRLKTLTGQHLPHALYAYIPLLPLGFMAVCCDICPARACGAGLKIGLLPLALHTLPLQLLSCASRCQSDFFDASAACFGAALSVSHGSRIRRVLRRALGCSAGPSSGK